MPMRGITRDSYANLELAGLTKLRLKSVLLLLGAAAMRFSSQIKPISYLKSHTAEIVKTLSDSREPMLITQNGEAKLVVMDVKTYEEQMETFALLKILALGRREVERGEFESVEDVFEELDGTAEQ